MWRWCCVRLVCCFFLVDICGVGVGVALVFKPLEVSNMTPSEGSNESLSEGGTLIPSEGFIGSPSKVDVGILGSIW